MITNKLRSRLLRLSRDLITCIPFQNKHFSFLLNKNNVLAVGYNMAKTSPLADRLGYYSKLKFGIHSEIHAILNFGHNQSKLRKCRLVNIRIGTDGRLRLAKPCPICKISLAKFGICDILYTGNDGNFYKMDTTDV